MTLIEGSWDEARRVARGVARPIGSEFIALELGAGRTASFDAYAKCNLPPFDSSAMDGWAVCGTGPWKIVGDAIASRPFMHELGEGTAIRIATGAVVPLGATSVVRSENAREDDGKLHTEEEVRSGQHIRRMGEECTDGERMIAAGSLLTPPHLGLLAAVGHDEVQVAVRPRVAILTFGDELLPRGVPTGGLIRDSLGPQLPAWLRAMGAEVASIHHVSDDYADALASLIDASTRADLIITTGGTANGPRDSLRAAIGEVGSLVVDCVRVRPGHPMLMGTIGETPMIGLPGNPHSALVALITLAQPIIDAMLGRVDVEQHVPTSDDLHPAGNGSRLIAGKLVNGAFTGAPFTGSAMLRGLANSSGFAVVPEEGCKVGELVRWLPNA